MSNPPNKVGLSEGARGRDVAALRSYLARYGYLRADPRKLEAEEDPVFDPGTTEALRHYQKFYKLKVTGTLNKATVEMMAKPRCGRPDVRPAPKIPPGAQGYVLENGSWPYRNLTFGVQRPVAELSEATVQAAMADAFSKWAAVTNLTFTEVPLSDPRPPDSAEWPDIIVLDDDDFDDTVLAYAYGPAGYGGGSSAIFFNDNPWVWGISPNVGNGPNDYDFTWVAIHEAGHTLGLGHSDVPGAIMYAAQGGPGNQPHNLHSDDVAGIRAIYPLPAPPPPPPPGPPVTPTVSISSPWPRPQLYVDWPQGQQPVGTQFEVRVAKSPDGPWAAHICGEGSTRLAYTEESGPDWWTWGPAQTRYFKVRAVNAAGTSADSPVLSGTKPAGVPVW